jgi:photosystem II stability/assembly factor-like uncharacterized protein
MKKLYFIAFIAFINFPAIVLSQSWSQCYYNKNFVFDKVFTLDANHAYIVGEHGVFLRTTDGGLTWQQFQTGITNYNLYDVQFLNDTIGFSCGDAGTLITTHNGGLDWNPCTTHTYLNLTGLYFINNSEGWMAANFGSLFPVPYTTGLILWTTDGGNTVSISKQVNASVQKVAAFNFHTCIAICNSPSYGFILKTTDEGVTWQNIYSTSMSSLGLSSIAIFPSGLTYVASQENTLFTSQDFGASWDSTDLQFYQMPLDMSFPSPLKGFTAGYDPMSYHGSICGTTNGGQTWHYQVQDSSFTSVSFCNDSVGFAATGNGRIYKYGLLTNVNSLNRQNVPDISIFPNPVHSSVNIKIQDKSSHYYSKTPYTAEIYSLLGNKILEQAFTGTVYTITGLEALLPGSYYLVLKNQEGNLYSRNFIKIE